MEDKSTSQSDLARLREQFPGWSFGSSWTTAGTGPDRRHLLACRGYVTITAWTAEELAAEIRREEQS